MLGVLALAAAALALASWYGAHVILTGAFRKPSALRPGDLGLPHEAVSFTTCDGLTLRGWFVPAARASDKTVLVCHGWSAEKGDMLERTHFLCGRFNVLYFDFRFCGESEGRLLSVGYLEARDFDAAVGYLERARPAQCRALGVYGLSMGAAVALGGLTRHPRIRAAVLESLFRSHDEVVSRYAWVRARIPYFPLVPLALAWIRWRLGADPESLSPQRLLPRLNGAPILGIFAENDPISPAREGRLLFERIPSPKELWVVPGVGHAECHAAAGAFEEKVAGFFARHL